MTLSPQITDISMRVLRLLVYITIILTPLVFLPKDFVLIEAEISYIAVPKVTVFRLLTTLMIPLIVALSLTKKVPFTPISLIVFAFVIWATVATYFSNTPELSKWGEFFGQDGYSLVSVFHYTFLFFAVAIAFPLEQHRDRLFTIIACTGALASVPIILQSFNAFPIDLIPPSEGRPSGTFGNSVFAGSFISLTLMATLYYLIAKEAYKKYLVPLSLLAGWQAFALITTETRSAILGFVVFCAVLGVQYGLKRKTKAILSVATLGVIFASTYLFLGGLERLQQIPDQLPSRLSYWNGAVTIANKYPLTGSGPDTFRYYYLNISPPTEIGLPEEPNHAHSWYFHHLAEMGYIGGILSTAIVLGPAIVSPSIASIFIGRSFDQLLSVARISDIMLLYVLIGVAHHETSSYTRNFYSLFRNTFIVLFRKLFSFYTRSKRKQVYSER